MRLWLLPIVTTNPVGAGVGFDMWKRTSVGQSVMPLPYWVPRRVTGSQTEYSDEPVMHVHSFGETYSAAAQAGIAADDRVRVLVEYPNWTVTLSSGRVVNCDWVEIEAAAHHEPYGAEAIVEHFVSEYRLGLSFT